MQQAGSACLSADVPPIRIEAHADANLRLQSYRVLMYTNCVATAPAVS